MALKDSENGDARRPVRVPIEAEVSLKFETFQGFLSEFSSNISTGGMFVKSAEPAPVGSVVEFSVKLRDDFKLIHGKGQVTWIREQDESEDMPAGMGIRFIDLVEPSAELVRKIVERQQAHGHAAVEPGRPGDEPRATAADLGPQVSVKDAVERPEVPAEDPVADPLEGLASDFEVDEASLFVDPDGTAALEGGPRGLDDTTIAVPASMAQDTGVAQVLIPPDGALERRRPAGQGEPDGAEREEGAMETDSIAGGSGGRRGPGRLSPAFIAVLIISGAAGGATYRLSEMLVDWYTGYDDSAVREVLDIPHEVTLRSEEVAAAQASREPPAAALMPQEPGPGSGSAAEAASTTAPGPAPPPAPPLDPLTQIRLITWKEASAGDGTLITLWGNGDPDLEKLVHVRLASRELLKIRGINWPFRDPALIVESAEVRRIRSGFHPKEGGNELHIVFDLASDEVELSQIEAREKNLLLYFTPRLPEVAAGL